MRISTLLATSALFASSIAFIPVAANAAADTAVDTPKAKTATATDDIVVTGSRLKRPALESPVPVTSIRTDQLLSGGSLSLGD
jgi:outer membrane receptor protein involved in Fe transport